MAAITSPTLSTISRGSSGLPVAWAGHTLVQRPHIVQASVSSSCFHVKSSTTDAPNVSSSVSARLGIGFIAPFGRSRSLQVHVQRRREHVAQHRDRQDARGRRRTRRRGAIHMHLVPAVEGVERPARRRAAQRVADEAPLLVARLRRSRRCGTSRRRSPSTPITRNVPRITACSGLVLMRMRYGRCT